jgi:hypothetical protein
MVANMTIKKQNDTYRFLHPGWRFDVRIEKCKSIKEALKRYNVNVKPRGKYISLDDLIQIDKNTYKLK